MSIFHLVHAQPTCLLLIVQAVHHLTLPSVLQDVAVALQRATAFMTKCGTIGPVYALLHAVELSQECTNSSLDIQYALSALDVAALGIMTDLQEDLSQFIRQLARINTWQFPEQHHKLLANLCLEVCGMLQSIVVYALLLQACGLTMHQQCLQRPNL